MHATTLSTLLLTLLTTTRAAPANGLSGGYYKCSEPNWKGHCLWFGPRDYAGVNYCRVDNPALHTQSLGPDPGTTCTTYKNDKCRLGDELEIIEYPGKATGLKEFKGIICGILPPNIPQ
jgi:hypothetical protein